MSEDDAWEREEKETTLCYQDVMTKARKEFGPQEFAANAFFELANAPWVQYRIDDRKKTISIQQDQQHACGNHTGGIVWETSYLLLNYLRQKYSSPSHEDKKKHPYPCGKTVLEVGAGCGLLGLGIYHSKLGKRVILTETDDVFSNLQQNVQRNYADGSSRKKSKSDSSSRKDKARACCLDWTRYQKDCDDSGIQAHSIDMIVGTDVVFSTRFVHPLLETLSYLAHSETIILLCLQERCPDSHRLLLSSAARFGLQVKDITEQVIQQKTCEWGRDLECCVLQLSVVTGQNSNSETAYDELKKRKRKR